MNDYYVNNNAQPNGDHEVHENGCNLMPSNRKYLGRFNNQRRNSLSSTRGRVARIAASTSRFSH